MGQGGKVVYRKLLMRKCMDIPTVLFSFLEAALKRRPKATEAEISNVGTKRAWQCVVVLE